MESGESTTRARMLRGGVILLTGMLLVGTLVWTLFGSGHNPNHDINMNEARAAANRVHTPPKLTPEDRAKLNQDHGG